MYEPYLKRIFDVLVSLLAVALLLWLFLFIVFVYLLSGRLKLIFSQQRIGYRNKIFTVYKFKTLKDPEPESDLQTRRFWWGDILRFLSLDELPQLFNVLKGDMSLVGPRPLPVEYFALMNERQRERHLVRPGITGWTQVNGRHQLRWQKKFELDHFYVTHVSFLLDLKILVKTLGLMLAPRKDVSLMEEKFSGN